MSDMENAMDIVNDQIINSAEADAAVDSTYVVGSAVLSTTATIGPTSSQHNNYQHEDRDTDTVGADFDKQHGRRSTGSIGSDGHDTDNKEAVATLPPSLSDCAKSRKLFNDYWKHC